MVGSVRELAADRFSGAAARIIGVHVVVLRRVVFDDQHSLEWHGERHAGPLEIGPTNDAALYSETRVTLTNDELAPLVLLVHVPNPLRDWLGHRPPPGLGEHGNAASPPAACARSIHHRHQR